MANSKNATYDIHLAHYEAAVASLDKVERKGKTMPYTSVNGHMFSFLDKVGTMGLRLSKEDMAAFISKHKSRMMEQHGRMMKEYVVVPEELLAKTSALGKYMQASLDHVSSLKPKPSKK